MQFFSIGQMCLSAVGLSVSRSRCDFSIAPIIGSEGRIKTCFYSDRATNYTNEGEVYFKAAANAIFQYRAGRGSRAPEKLHLLQLLKDPTANPILQNCI